MKREIICVQCIKKTIRMFESFPHTPGEHHKFVRGKSRKYCHCDACNVRIFAGHECAALSIWSENSPMPYYEWERDYLERN